MPVTFAHPAVVLVLRGTPLPMSALVIGAMVPDLPLFAPWLPLDYAFTHTPLGVVTINVVLGVIAWLLWVLVLRAPLTDAAPLWLRRRCPPAPTVLPRGASLLLVPVAVAIGAATHALWDEFTHAGRWGETHIAWLAAAHAGLPGYKWAQYVSGIGGLLVISVVVAFLLYRATPRPPEPRRCPHLAPWIVGAPVAALLAVAIRVAVGGGSLRHHLYTLITQGTTAAVVALVLACLAWHLLPAPAGTAATAARTPSLDDSSAPRS